MTVKKLRFSRDEEAYNSWWEGLGAEEKESLQEELACVTDESESEDALRRLTSTIFQELDGKWLRVQGLRPGTVITWLGLDIEPAYDGDGLLDGSTVVISLHVEVGGETMFISPDAYVSKPWREFAPEAAGPRAAVAEIIDYALASVHREQDMRDKFLSAREMD